MVSNLKNKVIYKIIDESSENQKIDNFLIKFIRGKLQYYISTEDFSDFKAAYQSENRGITEQVLKLSAIEKISIKRFLLNNLKEENKYYKYDFILDNCTTRLKDILKQIAKQEANLIITTDHGTINVNKPSKVIGDRNVNANLRYKQGRNLNYKKSDVFEMEKPWIKWNSLVLRMLQRS